MKGFGNKFTGSSIKAPHPGAIVCEGRQHQDRYIGGLSKPGTEFIPIDIREHKIEQNELRLRFLKKTDG